MQTSITLSQTKNVSTSKVKRFLIKFTPWIAALSVSALFIYAAINKLIIYNTFVQQLSQSPILKGFENFFAWLVPGIELLIPLLFLFKRSRLSAFYSSFFLMLLFTIYTYVLPHFFSKNLPCACGGIINGFGWKQHFYFNLLFTLIAAAGLVTYTYKQKPEQ